MVHPNKASHKDLISREDHKTEESHLAWDGQDQLNQDTGYTTFVICTPTE